MALIQVISARYLDNYRIALKFNTGEEGIVDLHDLIRQHPIAEPLKDIAEFKRFFLDPWPTLAWPCGYDVAPEALYRLAMQNSRK